VIGAIVVIFDKLNLAVDGVKDDDVGKLEATPGDAVFDLVTIFVVVVLEVLGVDPNELLLSEEVAVVFLFALVTFEL